MNEMAMKNNDLNLHLPSSFCESGVGLFYPSNLDEALLDIANKNRVSPAWGDTTRTFDDDTKRSLVAYYIGYAVMTDLWEGDESYKPFSGIEKLNIPSKLKSRGTDIVRFGCASDASYLLEKKALVPPYFNFNVA